ncbi:MAG TPA: hypothetical protein VMH85_14175 [Terriglobales bacterium]|nr:hypothetical protein [Terriglobales bacterium]
MSEERRKRREERNSQQREWSLGKKLAVVVLVVGVAVGAYYLATRKRPGRLDAFAKCLTERQAKMYGAFWCPHCQEQKEMFGSSFEYAPYIECGVKGSRAEQPVCTQAGVKNYPTWWFADGSHVEGTLPLSALAQKTGCSLP